MVNRVLSCRSFGFLQLLQHKPDMKKKKKRSGEHFYIGQTSLLLTDESIPSK